MVDVSLVLKGPVNCDKPFTIAFYRRNGEVAELRETVAQLPHAARCRRRSAPTARTTTATG